MWRRRLPEGGMTTTHVHEASASIERGADAGQILRRATRSFGRFKGTRYLAICAGLTRCRLISQLLGTLIGLSFRASSSIGWGEKAAAVQCPPQCRNCAVSSRFDAQQNRTLATTKSKNTRRVCGILGPFAFLVVLQQQQQDANQAEAEVQQAADSPVQRRI